MSEQAAHWQPVTTAGTRERWNDWGIGLLLQGDLKGAEYAFRKATEAEPGYADGWLNVARALIQEGETEAAKPFIQRALKIDPSLGRIYFFRAMTQKSDGDYDAALKSLERVEAQYPRDRVTLNQIARILFLKREYAKAIGYLSVSAISIRKTCRCTTRQCCAIAAWEMLRKQIASRFYSAGLKLRSPHRQSRRYRVWSVPRTTMSGN